MIPFKGCGHEFEKNFVYNNLELEHLKKIFTFSYDFFLTICQFHNKKF